MKTVKIILASASPRRLELLRQIKIDPIVHVAEIDEIAFAGEEPKQFVRRMAEEKTASVTAFYDIESVVIGADTVVVSGDQIFGKPTSYDSALAMLSSLSGKRHQVLTAVCVSRAGAHSTCIVESSVRFRKLTSAEIAAYWQTKEPLDKAGAYAIQGMAAMFVEEIQGSYSGIMGLPLYEVARLLAAVGVKMLDSDI